MEHLLAEIVQLTIADISLAIEWLKCSYLYVRLKKNPENYGIKRGIPHECLERHMQEICVEKIKELSEHGMIWTDEDGFLLKPLEPGSLMTKFYLKFNTMKLIVKAPGSCSVEDVLHIVSRSEELSWIQLRRNEKKLLNDINSDKEGRLRFHVLTENGKRKKRIQTREEKIYVLANDCLTGDPLVHDLSFNQDTNSICMIGGRIAKCMKEYFIYRKNYKGTINSTLLAKCLHHKLWENSPYLLKQLPGIGMVTAKALHSAGINSFQVMAEADPRKLEIITGRKYPFGNHIKESLLLLPPKIEISIEESECKKAGKLKLIVTLHRTEQSTTSTRHHFADILVGSEEDNMILFHEKIRAEEFPSPYVVTVFASYPLNARVTVRADLMFEEYVGLDVHEKLAVTKGINCFKTKKGQLSEYATSYSLPKEIYAAEHGRKSNSRIMSDGTKDLNNLNSVQSAMPSFDLLREETDTDPLAPEPRGTEFKTISEDMIFDHIRKKSKTFPSITTSSTIDYSCQPSVLRRVDTSKKQGFEVKVDLNTIILIGSESSDEDSQKHNHPINFSTDTEKVLAKNPSMLKSEIPHRLSTPCTPGHKKPVWNDSLKDVQRNGCKGSLPNESNPASERPICWQHQMTSIHGSQGKESILEFKSVFSFL